MRILCDRHHSGLTDSLILLFQKRLGWDIYFQKGMEWYPEFWDLQPFKETAVQYLERELEGLPGITLEEFKKAKFDVLLCSVPQHVPLFIKLRDLYQPEAKLIFQVGNMWSFDSFFPIKNIMASAIIPDLVGFHTVSYHQEFDLNIFHNEPVKSNKKIYSFINCLNTVDLYKKDWELFLELERLLPEFEFRSFGGQTRDGAIWDRQELADKMREATLIYMVKSEGDGYGHSIHSAAAVGRPLITRYSDYKGKLAEPFMQWNMSINVENQTPEEIARQIREQENFEVMGQMIHEKFKEVVDFDKEELLIREFLANLV